MFTTIQTQINDLSTKPQTTLPLLGEELYDIIITCDLRNDICGVTIQRTWNYTQ